jgi:hypothetical protein
MPETPRPIDPSAGIDLPRAALSRVPRSRSPRVVAFAATMRASAAVVRASMAICVLGFVGCGGSTKAPPEAAGGGNGGGGGTDGMPLGGNAGTRNGGAAGDGGSAGGGADDASARDAMAEATSDARPPFACDGGKCSPIVVGGFDAARGGDYSFEFGHFSQARDALLATFPGSRLVSFSELTAAALAGIDVLVISSVTADAAHFAPLSFEEQTALVAFVKGGGCYVALPDNDMFGGPDTPAANASLISPFNTTIGGLMNGLTSATLSPTAGTHPVVIGPFAHLLMFSQNYPGAFTSVGPDATVLATNPLGPALAVMDRGSASAGAGSVVMFSDVNSFSDSPGSGLFPENRSLFLNTMAHCGSR